MKEDFIMEWSMVRDCLLLIKAHTTGILSMTFYKGRVLSFGMMTKYIKASSRNPNFMVMEQ